MPFAYCFCDVESILNLTLCLEAVEDATIRYFNVSFDNTWVEACQSDRGTAIVGALEAFSPGVPILQCWVHLDKKFTENKLARLANEREKVGDYQRYIELIHLCSTPEMAEVVSRLVLRWMRSDGEDRIAHHLQTEYLCERFFTWTLGNCQLARHRAIETVTKSHRLHLSRVGWVVICQVIHRAWALFPTTTLKRPDMEG